MVDVRPDVLIVGTGPAGQYLAEVLGPTGASVVVLDEGTWPLRHQHRADHVGSLQIGPQHAPIRHQVAVGYGGTSRLWGVRLQPGIRGIRMVAPRPHDLVDPARPDDDNWPLDHRTFLPWLREAVHRIQPDTRGRLPDDPFVGPDWGRFLLPGADSRWYYFGSVEPFQRNPHRLPSTYPNVSRQFGMKVADIGPGPVVRVIDRGDRTERILRPRTVVLACGGLESVRVLLASQAIANEAPALGTRYMERPRYIGELLEVPATVDLGAILPQLEMRATEWRMAHLVIPPASTGGSVSLTPFPVANSAGLRERAKRLVNLADSYATQIPGRISNRRVSELARRVDTAILDRLARIAGSTADMSWDHLARPASQRPSALQIRGTVEHLPHEANRLRLSGERDSFGLPGLVAEVGHHRGEIDAARDASARYAAHLEELGCRRLPSAWAIESYASHHQMGGARMGNDPSTSVVDADLQVHALPGCYVLSSAVYPSSGCVNPTLPVIALALRLGEHLSSAAGRQP
jgi:choline dehydrogenase-like flavoprotein